ncbi:alcohol dehydrogenase catalytic domain-containing protein [Streptomyces bohaiensis]|uniref:Alcohol dehydrogenase catalytic domain-containing protein n=1 Tax=Streptomyces bohaiensis TaxID=1431344 RepID=A0ABX1C8N8_9ACTN|nr:alcohol dehydrogenase catalytic domain-containing protein [Streptomyces bohaiensis]NJQ15510.1 alcohol dehydrogenase catalytic domain-containing protein [Streptomyces bohaiensis]
MHALVFKGTGDAAWEDRPDPRVESSTDAVVRIDTTTICGTDLHILAGDVPEVAPGTVLGHEAVGEVVDTGSAVADFRPGDRVLVSCISGCGRCSSCRGGRYGQCTGGGGWVLGHTVDGTQAEFTRVPNADFGLHHVPEAEPAEKAVLLSDVFPTAFEVGALNGRVAPGDTVLVVGAGPIGLAVVAAVRLFSPARVIVTDRDDTRLRAARAVGADATVRAEEDPGRLVADLTDGLGADVAVEAVGTPATFELCAAVLRPGGRLANVGVHGSPASLALHELWNRNVTITTGLVDTFSTPRLLSMLASDRLPAGELVTHRFALEQMEEAYATFGDALGSEALKVVLAR